MAVTEKEEYPRFKIIPRVVRDNMSVGCAIDIGVLSTILGQPVYKIYSFVFLDKHKVKYRTPDGVIMTKKITSAEYLKLQHAVDDIFRTFPPLVDRMEKEFLERVQFLRDQET